VLEIFRSNAVLRRRTFLTGKPIGDGGAKDLSWIRPDGHEMADEDWREEANHIVGMLLHGRATDEVDERGRPIFGKTILMLFNGGARTRPFTLPQVGGGGGTWSMLINTAQPGQRFVRGETVTLVAHSFQLLRWEEPSA
jgi:glycogen operon protein